MLARPLLIPVTFSLLGTLLLSWAAYLGDIDGPDGPEIALFGSGFKLSLVAWMEADARQRRRTPYFDFGFITYIFFPLAFPWYCLRTYGWRSVGLWLLFVLLLAVPVIAREIVWTMAWE